MSYRLGLSLVALVCIAVAQNQEQPRPSAYTVETGTLVPLSLINSISTKNAVEGDRVYLESVFPILSGGKIVIPPGSYVAGTVTQVKRPGRIRGRGELFVRFDTLTLPNGVTRDFRGRIGGIDSTSSEELDRTEGKIKGDTNKGGDARTVGETASAGATIGAIAGRTGKGVGLGAAGGAAAGLIGVLASRGPEAVLAKGTTVEMVLDRVLTFSDDEIDFSSAPMSRRGVSSATPAQTQQTERQSLPLPGRRIP